MASVSEALAQAQQHHQAGAWQQAEQLYRQVLRLEPQHSQTLHLLGVLAHQTGRHAEAVDLIQQALQRQTPTALVYNHLGAAYGADGQLERAEESFRKALELEPADAQIHFNLAALLNLRAQTQQAIDAYREALRLNPQMAEAHYNLGNLLRDLGDLQRAAQCFHQAIAANPRYVKAWLNLASVLRSLEHLEQAADAYRNVLNIQPRHAEAHYRLGCLLQTQFQWARAAEHLQQAATIKPEHAEAHNNLGCALLALEQPDRAAEAFQKAIQLNQTFAEAHNNLGTVFEVQGQFDEALRHYDHALTIEPDFAQGHYNRSLIFLRRGDFARGWADYDWRLRTTTYKGLKLAQPLWDGSPLEHQRLLIHSEQGLGDIIQFIRYVPLVRERVKNLIVGVPQSLMPLLEQSGFDDVLARDVTTNDFDVQLPLLSLPRVFGTTLESIPAEVPYLRVDWALVESWREALQAFPGFRVGINWQGNPAYMFDRFRSIPLAQFEPLAQIPGVRLLSLQKKEGLDQLQGIANRFAVVDLASRLDEGGAAFVDTAAVMKSLDLVITSDTATAHLAGALGVPVWVGLSFAPEWRWMLERSESPWYSTMRLFRQRRVGDWKTVMQDMADQVRRLIEDRRKE